MVAPVELTDVCLILEGTYPYVRGGVSSWAHNLIRGLPEVTFSLLAVSPARHVENELKYELPPNVKVFAEVFIHELASEGRARRPGPAAWQAFERFHRTRGAERTAALRALLLASALPGAQGAMTADYALFSRSAWELMVERYGKEAPGTSFIDWFWTWRAVNAPLFQTMVSEIPPARVYHPLSTGYAGLLGAIAKLRTGRPLLVTEHGIYVRERILDIQRADWVHEEPVPIRAAEAAPNPLKALWSDFFLSLAQVTYDEADQIATLFEGNRELQHELGAPPERTRVITNGVRADFFEPLAAARGRAQRPPRVGFVGRVVPIKDCKTLLKAFDIVSKQNPSVEFWVVGPTEEDPTYFEECVELVKTLGIQRVRFTGSQEVKRVYPEIDVMVLTSLSEGQPLTILEAACAGVPTVATDVGDCRSLIEGRAAADRALGPCGLVTRMGDANETAQAILRILGSPDVRAQMSRAGVARAKGFYAESLVLDAYRELYRALAAGDVPAAAPRPQPRLQLV